MSKHTPGPWQVHSDDTEDKENPHFRIRGTRPGDRWKIANAHYTDPEFDRDSAEANAQLIAASPELLEALRFCRSVIEKSGVIETSERMAIKKADAAIAKATA